MINFHILTLFPEMVMQGLHTSILGRAAERGYISMEAVNIRDYTHDKHGKVDDYTYGGGAGMLMQAQPVYDAWQAVAAKKRIIRGCLFHAGEKNESHLCNAPGQNFPSEDGAGDGTGGRSDLSVRTL